MPHYYGVPAILGAAAAAEHKRRLDEEEEQMTPYTDEELQSDWEFKIVRSGFGVFDSPERFKKLQEEEKRAGWVLLEKLDGSRVRFKRQRSAQANDAQLLAGGIDPYRTGYSVRISAVGVTAILTVIVIFIVLGWMIWLSSR